MTEINNAIDQLSYECQLCKCKESFVETRNIKDWEFGAGNVYEYRKCINCNQVQLYPFPTLQQLEAAYPDDYSAYVNIAQNRGIIYNTLYKFVNFIRYRRLRVLIPKGAKILDVGCGNGQFLAELVRLGATELHGVDFNEKAVELAQKKGINAYKGVFLEYVEKKNSFSAIFMNHYIEHVLNPKAEIEKAYVLLKKNGYLIGELPNFSSLERRWFKRYWGGNHVPRHTFQYDRAQLHSHLSAAGFSDIKINYELNSGELAASIQNWLQRNVPDLSNNPALTYGRMKGFNALLLFFLPLSAMLALIRQSGIISFQARK